MRLDTVFRGPRWSNAVTSFAWLRHFSSGLDAALVGQPRAERQGACRALCRVAVARREARVGRGDLGGEIDAPGFERAVFKDGATKEERAARKDERARKKAEVDARRREQKLKESGVGGPGSAP